VLNHNIKVFLFVLLLVSITLFPSVHLANALEVICTGTCLIVESGSQHIVTTQEDYNLVAIESGGKLIIKETGELTVNSIDPINDGFFIGNGGDVLIEKGGDLTVNGLTQVDLGGKMFVDGTFKPAFLLFNFGKIFISCGTYDDSEILGLSGPPNFDTFPCTGNITEEQNLVVNIGELRKVESNEKLVLLGDAIVRGTLENNGIIENHAHLLIDGGLLKNSGTIINICENHGIARISVSAEGGQIQNSGTMEAQNPFCGPPIANDDPPEGVLYEVSEDGVLNVDAAEGVLINDVDVEMTGVKKAINLTDPAHGELDFDDGDGSFTYTPDENFFGTDTFEYDIKDGSDRISLSPATVTIVITPVFDRPIAVDDDYDVSEDGVLNVEPPGVLENDLDVDYTGLTAKNLTVPTNGELNFEEDGSFEYTPNENFFGTDTFEYEIKDGHDLLDTALVTIVVTEVFDGPITNPDFYDIVEGGVLIVDGIDVDEGVLINDVDVDETGTLIALRITEPASDGTVTLESDGSFTYTPDEDFVGTDTFEYEVKDGHDLLDTALVTIVITPVFSGPIAVDDDYSVSENGVLNVEPSSVLENDIDVDDTGLTAKNLTVPTNGELKFEEDGSFEYTPNENFFGEDSFVYEASNKIITEPLAFESASVSASSSTTLAFESASVSASSSTTLAFESASVSVSSSTALVTIVVTEVFEGTLLDQKMDKIDELEDLIDESTENKTVNELKEAVEDLRKSTESEKWNDDGNSLVEKEGKKVFKEQEKGVKHIMKVLKDDNESQDFILELETIMLAFVDIDEQLAKNEFFNASVSENPDGKELVKAMKEFKKVEKEKVKNHYHHMIKHLGHAWDKSVKAQNSHYDEGDSVLEDWEVEFEDDEGPPGPQN